MSSLKRKISSRANGPIFRRPATPAGFEKASPRLPHSDKSTPLTHALAIVATKPNLTLRRFLQDMPPAEDMGLPNDPSPISGQLSAPDAEAGVLK
jgi:hypothetical protein